MLTNENCAFSDASSGEPDLTALCDEQCIGPILNAAEVCPQEPGDEEDFQEFLNALPLLCGSTADGGPSTVDCLGQLEDLEATCNFEATFEADTVDGDAVVTFCENDCGNELRRIMRCIAPLFDDAEDGENPSEIFEAPEVRAMFDMMCLQHEGEYCVNELQTILNEENGNELEPCTADQSDLEQMCNPCFRKVSNRLAGVIATLGDDDDAAEFSRGMAIVNDIICLKDEGEFCILEASESLGFCEDDEGNNNEDDDSAPTQAELEVMCDSSCNTKILIKLAQHAEEDERRQLQTQVNVGCAKKSTGEFCLPLIEKLDSEENAGLATCPDWFATASANGFAAEVECEGECQVAAKDVIEELGCCWPIVFDFWSGENGAAMGSVLKARMQEVAVACDAEIATEAERCDRKIGSKKVKGAIVLSTDTDVCANAQTKASVLEAAKVDIAVTVGTSPDNIVNVECVSGAGRRRQQSSVLVQSSIEFEIQGQNDEETLALGESFVAAVEADDIDVAETTAAYVKANPTGSIAVDAKATTDNSVNASLSEEVSGDSTVDSASSVIASVAAVALAAVALVL